MGASQSIPESLPSRQKYKGTVVPAQDLVNQIFRWMMEQMDTNDLLKLANPKSCKDYIFLTKEAIDRFMRQIQLEPKLGNRNVLYFQSVKQLTFGDDRAEKAQPAQKEYRDALCAQLAFFTVRLFQIFGALALTVIDSLPDVSPTLKDIREAAQRPGALGKQPTLFGPAIGGAKVGPNDSRTLGNFYTYVSNYFTTVDVTVPVYAIVEPAARARGIQATMRDVIFFYPEEELNIQYPTKQNTEIRARIEITNASEKVFTLNIFSIQINESDIGMSYSIPFTKKLTEFYYENNNFHMVVKTVLDSVQKESTRGKRLEELFRVRGEAGKAAEKLDERGVPEGFSYSKIESYLKSKPKAYCVARAIQLLSPTLIENMRSEVYQSQVCFFDPMMDYMKDSVPQYGQAITTNTPGIRQLNQLFYDILKNNAPAMDKQTEPKYLEFVSIMQSIFSPVEPQKPVDKLEKVISLPFGQCKGTSLENKRIILTTKNAIRETQKSVAALLNYQMAHTARVAKFMTRLFNLDKKGVIIGIHPTILKGGIPMINKLAEEARNLLTDYYKYCESTYRIGALRVLGLREDQRIIEDRRT
jgi:hypothetical protein